MMTNQRLDNIKAQLAAGAPGGETWSLGYEPCSCGEYCVHGVFPYSIEGPVNVHTGDLSVREICDFTEAAGQLVAEAPEIIRELLEEVDRQRDRSAGIERAAANRTYSFGVRYADQSANDADPKMKAALDGVLATAADLEERGRVFQTKASGSSNGIFADNALAQAKICFELARDLRGNIDAAFSPEQP